MLLLKIKECIFCFIITCMVSFALFCLLFYFKLHINSNLLIYNGIFCLIICGLVNCILGIVLKNFIFKRVSYIDLVSITILFCSITFTFFVLVPITIERSVSVYMLCEMSDTNKEYTVDEMETELKDTYIESFSAVSKRFDEQLVLGTVQEVSGNKYIINKSGKKIVELFRLIVKVFNIDKRIVYPHISEESIKDEVQ